ncbi:hypothetical protein LCGC14_0176270 [marine sediment metagenome]|uniref:Uncharacterized protein n=1 Tax=marine sediment metagenome TaxID=412755 RepID=A0A0F9XTX5_9ZZZZ
MKFTPLILVIIILTVAFVFNNKTTIEIENNPPMKQGDNIYLTQASISSPDHMYWGKDTSEYQTNSTHTWVDVLFDLTFLNYTITEIGYGKFKYRVYVSHNYSVSYAWNVVGNTSYFGLPKNEEFYASLSLSATTETDALCETPVCLVDEIADIQLRFFIDVPTLPIVDWLEKGYLLSNLEYDVYLITFVVTFMSLFLYYLFKSYQIVMNETETDPTDRLQIDYDHKPINP